MSHPVKRKILYIDKDFQNKFIVKFCGLVAGGAVLTMIVLFLFTRMSTTVSIVNSRVVVMTTADFLMPILLQTVILVSIALGLATIFMTLLVSHKIAGPLYRFRQTFKELAQGNFTNQVRLRKDDQLHEVAGEFNQMINAIRVQVHEAHAAIDVIKSDIESIGDFNVEDAKRHRFVELKQKVRELEKTLEFFKT